MKHRTFVDVGKRMSRRKRNRGRPRRVTNKSGPPKTASEALSQAGLDAAAGKLEEIADQTSARADGETHFAMMARKWAEENKLVSPDWKKADREDRRRFIVQALQYPLKSKKRT
jgi:hypothetical protein